MLSLEDKKWVNEVWDKTVAKMEKVSRRSYDKLPHITVDGVHDDMKEKRVFVWTNGFFGGLMWLLYSQSKKEVFKDTAIHQEELLDKAFEKYEFLHHDVGFMWLLTSGANYKLTENRESFLRLMHAADILGSRFEIDGRFIRAWPIKRGNFSIIDSMMNLNLLFRASEITGDERYRKIAMAHADMTMENHIRPDGSVVHVVEHDMVTGQAIANKTGQGYDENSSWSRGQSWALYGFTLAYIHTGKQEYLDTAKKVAHYFLAAVAEDYLPRCDFRSPEEPVYYDSTAGAIAACGLIELARILPEHEKRMYFHGAMKLLKTMEKHFCDWDENTDAILTMGTVAYSVKSLKNVPIIYGDFYFIEALHKLMGNELFPW